MTTKLSQYIKQRHIHMINLQVTAWQCTHIYLSHYEIKEIESGKASITKPILNALSCGLHLTYSQTKQLLKNN